MDVAFLGLLALVIGVSVAGGTLTSWKLHRRTLALEYRISDLEERQTTLTNREKAQTRWRKKDAELEEFERSFAATGSKKSTQRFANDPMEPEL